MQIQLIRNATMKICMAGKTILTDPVLSSRHGIESFAGIEKNPTVDLPFSVENVVKDIDAVLVSHLHQDHFDAAAREVLPKDISLFCQPADEAQLRENGFKNVTPVAHTAEVGKINIARTKGSHAGNKQWQDILGQVSGFMFKAENEPTVYWTGDTILTDEVEKTIRTRHPDIILTHSCGAVLDDSGPIVMDAAQTIAVCKLAPWAVVVAVHLEALDHGTVSREDIKKQAKDNQIPPNQLIIPGDGEILTF